MPPIESLAVGTPVIASNRSPLKDNLEDASFYVNPNSKLEIYECLLKILVSNSSNEKVLKGKQIAKKFLWKKIAVNHYNLYKNFI